MTPEEIQEMEAETKRMKKEKEIRNTDLRAALKIIEDKIKEIGGYIYESSLLYENKTPYAQEALMIKTGFDMHFLHEHIEKSHGRDSNKPRGSSGHCNRTGR
jgi:hypothetical protein